MSNACVSHEMRNPLNSICAMNDLKIDMYKQIRQESGHNPEVAKVMDDLD